MRNLRTLAGMAALMASGSHSICFADDGSAGASTGGSASPMRQVTIAGESFEIAAPYAAGHQLNEAEASVLNQTYLENIRNNAAGRIKAAKEKNGADFSLDAPIGGEGEDAGKTLRQVIAEYASTYEFGVRVARNSEPADPVEREARVIAREAINAKLKASNVKRKDIADEAYEQALVKLAASENVMAEARRRVEARNSIGLDELGLSPTQAAATPSESDEDETDEVEGDE